MLQRHAEYTFSDSLSLLFQLIARKTTSELSTKKDKIRLFPRGGEGVAGGDGQLTDVGFHHAVVHTPGFSQIHTAVQKYRACY